MSYNNNYNNYPYGAGNYPGQAPRAPQQAQYSMQMHGAPPGGIPPMQNSAPGAPAMAYSGQAPGIRPTSYGGQYAQQPQAPASSYQGQQKPKGAAQPQVNAAIASWFQAVDQDNSGYINGSELRLALQNGNWSQFSEEACNLMICMFDKNHTGTIDLQEFDQLFGFVNQWTECYQRFDLDKSGTISENEMANALQQMGYRLSPQFINFLVNKYASKKARGITLDNFILINVKIKNLTEAFRSRDREMKGVITVSYEDFLQMTLSSV